MRLDPKAAVFPFTARKALYIGMATGFFLSWTLGVITFPSDRIGRIGFAGVMVALFLLGSREEVIKLTTKPPWHFAGGIMAGVALSYILTGLNV